MIRCYIGINRVSVHDPDITSLQQPLYERIAAEPDRVLLALGGNLPFQDQSVIETLLQAVDRLRDAGFEDLAVSRLFRTPCFPPGAGPDYVNAAASAVWRRSASAALQCLHKIEAEFGRARAQRWGMRTLDLDLLALGQTIAPNLQGWRDWADLAPTQQQQVAPDHLILPHPRLAERAFVLVPLADVAADWVHPVTGNSVAQMCAALPAHDLAQIVPVPEAG